MESILIVDDNSRNLQLLAQLVQECGFEPVLALGGPQALQYLSQEVPDLILLDVLMPELNGYEVCRQIKCNPVLSEIPVIFLSAKDDKASIEEGFAAGGSDYVTKPFSAVEVKSRMNTHLELKKCREELARYRTNAPR